MSAVPIDQARPATGCLDTWLPYGSTPLDEVWTPHELVTPGVPPRLAPFQCPSNCWPLSSRWLPIAIRAEGGHDVFVDE